jgi:hypothetical protein
MRKRGNSVRGKDGKGQQQEKGAVGQGQGGSSSAREVHEDEGR